jgi:hypothetical protein
MLLTSERLMSRAQRYQLGQRIERAKTLIAVYAGRKPKEPLPGANSAAAAGQMNGCDPGGQRLAGAT